MKARQHHGLVLLAWTLGCLALHATAFLTSPPFGHHRRAAPAPLAARKRKQTDVPTPSPSPATPVDRGIVVVVVNEKTTRFYHGLLRPPFTHPPPSATYVHPPDPYQFQKHCVRGHPRRYRGKQALHSSHIGPRQPKPGSSQWPDQQHYMRAIEEHLAAASRALIIGHGKAKGEAGELLLKDLTHANSLLREKVMGLVRLDDTHLTDRQILRVARQVVFGMGDPRKPRRIHGQPMPPPSDT